MFYTPTQVAALLLQISPKNVIARFSGMAGVLTMPDEGSREKRERYRIIKIPKHVSIPSLRRTRIKPAQRWALRGTAGRSERDESSHARTGSVTHAAPKPDPNQRRSGSGIFRHTANRVRPAQCERGCRIPARQPDSVVRSVECRKLLTVSRAAQKEGFRHHLLISSLSDHPDDGVVTGAVAAGAGGAGFGLISTLGNAVFRLSSKLTPNPAND